MCASDTKRTSKISRRMSAMGVKRTSVGRSMNYLALLRKGFQASASRLASSKCPSSKSLPINLKYSQRNDASDNWYTRSPGTHKPNFLAEINADAMSGLRSRTLFGHSDRAPAVRILMMSERLRNLEPRLRSSEALFSSDFRANQSNEMPITIPVKKTNANLNQSCWPRAMRLVKTVVAIAFGFEKKFSSNHFSRMVAMRGISRRPQTPIRIGLSLFVFIEE